MDAAQKQKLIAAHKQKLIAAQKGNLNKVTNTAPAMKTSDENPANARVTSVNEDNRIPMSTPSQKLAVPEISGFHLHWFLSENVSRALRAGYTYVDHDEVRINNLSLADDPTSDGSTDLGTRVSIAAGRGLDIHGQSERLYLMKLKQEWWEKDQEAMESKNDQVAAALRGGAVPQGNPHGSDHTHTPNWAPQRSGSNNNLFTPKRR